MDPMIYEQVATFEELDRQPSESERALADGVEFGRFDETGGEVGDE